jgi:hypothetical protein
MPKIEKIYNYKSNDFLKCVKVDENVDELYFNDTLVYRKIYYLGGIKLGIRATYSLNYIVYEYGLYENGNMKFENDYENNIYRKYWKEDEVLESEEKDGKIIYFYLDGSIDHQRTNGYVSNYDYCEFCGNLNDICMC